ncbi:hypothetical protein B0T16DRAFT_300785, partial [Cercophora newfieldiana]
PPAEPYPWLWRCHTCHTTYRIACTRRCLRCSHVFCTGPPVSRKSRGPCKSEFDYSGWAAWGSYRRSLPSLGDIDMDTDTDISTLEQKEAIRGDTYATWEPTARPAHWRKIPKKEEMEVSYRKEAMYMRREHDCWKHCDFPSECRHAVYAA